MDSPIFIKGAIIGFSIAAPVGPIGVLCLRRSISQGMAVGFVSGLGAATADALYGAVAAFGLTAVSSFLVRQRTWLGLLGGLFLCYLGVRTFLAKPAETEAQTRGGRFASSYASTLLLTITNPATILSFVAIFIGFGVATPDNSLSASLLVAGVFLGSAAWWLILSSGAAFFRARLTPTRMRFINWLAGGILLAFGILALLQH